MAPLRTAERLIRTVERAAAEDGTGVAAPGTWTLTAARAAVSAVQAARAAVAEFQSRAEADRELLGDLYEDRETSVADVTTGLDWITTLRESCALRQESS